MNTRAALFAVLLFSAPQLRAEDPVKFEVGGLTFQRPAEWGWVPVTSSMRKAQLKVPGAEGKQPAEITFFHFGAGSGGDVASNAQRWLAQFRSAEGAAKTETQDVSGTKVTIVTTEGTFSSGMPGGPTTPMENYALLGAIIEGPQGSVFVKMTGPKETVKGAEKQFMNFVTSAVTAR